MSDRASRLRGAAAIQEMLDLIGEPERTDHDVAKVLCDQELDIRAFLIGAMDDLVTDMDTPRHT